jgi:hypothetical protein
MNPYKAVYGQKMDHMVMCTKHQARGCLTLPEILKVTDNPKFQEYAEDNYFLADEVDNNDVDNDADGYFSDGSLPRKQMDEVDDDFFFGHILEDLSDDNNLNPRPIGDEGIVDDVPYVVGVVRPDSDVDTAVVGGTRAALRPNDELDPHQVNAVLEGEELLNGEGVSDGKELLNASDFVLPGRSADDFLAIQPQVPTHSIPVTKFAAQSTDVAQKLHFEPPEEDNGNEDEENLQEVNGDESTTGSEVDWST